MSETAKPVVLIVDDAPSNIQVLAACLKEHYQIKVATCGEDCLGFIAHGPKPDLILLDIEMPGMDGYEVCQRIQQDSQSSDIPVIFVTARDEDRNEEKGLQLGAVDYITKPVKPAIVLARVNTHITLKMQRDILREIALRDQLTGLYNRHYLLEAAAQKIAESRRHTFPVSLLMMDIDHFKQVNDQQGHLVGDSVLKHVAAELADQCRREDIAARFGGEEFVMLLCQCDLNASKQKAEQLRLALEQLKPEGLLVTASIGVTQLQNSDSNIDQLIDRADKALYKAKEQGRNRVESS